MSKARLLVGSLTCLMTAATLSLTTFAQTPGQPPAGGPPAAGAQGGPGGGAPGGPGAGGPGGPGGPGGQRNQATLPYPLEPYQHVGYSMELPYQIAAQVLAESYPSPKKIVDVGSYQGQFLQAFMDRFPAARGQWTEPVTTNELNAKRKLARFGDRVDYVIGCPGRDIALGCLPADTDVMITAWVSHHQPIDEISRIYKLAYEKLPANGWLIVLDNITAKNAQWESRFKQARWYFDPDAEGPPMEPKVRGKAWPTLDEQLAAFKNAGFTDYSVVWQSMDAVLIMAHK